MAAKGTVSGGTVPVEKFDQHEKVSSEEGGSAEEP
jgi:hypothetical protein